MGFPSELYILEQPEATVDANLVHVYVVSFYVARNSLEFRFVIGLNLK